MKDLIGMTLGGYQIIEQLGRGGMAVVYKAFQPSLDRQVAVKILPEYLTHEPDFEKRFLREAKAVAKLEHPNILAVYDTGVQDDVHYIAMRYVEAGTLKSMMGQPLPLEQVVRIVRHLADALDHAHDHGVIHRDIKPSNVLVDTNDWVLLTDFGVARMMESTEQLTASGVGIGTPAYMSPEQGQGGTVDRRSDVYSLGVMLFEMLTGRLPYEADTPLAIVMKHIQDPLPMVRELNPRLPERVEQAILKAMAKSSDDRFQSAGEMAKALNAAAVSVTETAVPDEETRIEAEPAPARRFPIWVLAPIGLAIVAAAVILLGGRSADDGQAEPTDLPAAVADIPAVVEPTTEPEPEPAPTELQSDEFSFFDGFAGAGGYDASAWELSSPESCSVTQEGGFLSVDANTTGASTECTLTSLAMELEAGGQVGSVSARLQLADSDAQLNVEQLLRFAGLDNAGNFWITLCGLWISDGQPQAHFSVYSTDGVEHALEVQDVEFDTWHTFTLTSRPFRQDGAELTCSMDGASIGRTTTPADAGLGDTSFQIQLHAFRHTDSAAVSYVDDVEITVIDE